MTFASSLGARNQTKRAIAIGVVVGSTRNPLGGAVVVGYVRCSTAEQTDSGLGLTAQRTAIKAECERRGWTLDAVYEDAGASGKALQGRPALAEALGRLDRGDASTLVVAKLDRLTRSVRDAADMLDRSARHGWALVALDLGVDTTTPAGEAMANVMTAFAQLERRLISQRTRDALAVKRSQGVRLGRPRSLPQAVVDRIVSEREQTRSWSAIARDLDAEGVPTAQGGKRWYPATVRAVYRSARPEIQEIDPGQRERALATS